MYFLFVEHFSSNLSVSIDQSFLKKGEDEVATLRANTKVCNKGMTVRRVTTVRMIIERMTESCGGDNQIINFIIINIIIDFIYLFFLIMV